MGELREFRPGDDQAVVCEGFGSPFLALAGGIEPVGEVAGHLGHAAKLAHQVGSAGFPLRFTTMNQVLGDFPGGEPGIGCRVPIGGQFLAV